MKVWTQWVSLTSGVTYFARAPLCSYVHDPQKYEIYFLNILVTVAKCEVRANSICVNLYWAIDTFLERPDTCPWFTFFNERLACKEDGKLINVKERKRKGNNGQHMIFRKTMTGYPRSVTMNDRRPPLTQGDREVKTWNHKTLHTSRQPAQR